MRSALATWVAACHAAAGGRAVRAANLHVTLAFLGDVDEGRLPELDRIARESRGEPFELELEHVEYWRHNRIVHATPQHVPCTLVELVARLGRGLEAVGFRVEKRPFAAHATLLRDARPDPDLPAVAPIRWSVASFALLQSSRTVRGVSYVPCMQWTLASRDAILPAPR